jgi:type IV pilus assembly protein PilA
MHIKNKGFTLIELMIVIAIIGILMSYAIPSYRDYTVKAKRGECHSVATHIKTAIAVYYNEFNQFPPDLGTLYINTDFSTNNISSITMIGNNNIDVDITCEFYDPAGGGDVTYSGTESGGFFYWDCTDSLGASSPSEICN